MNKTCGPDGGLIRNISMYPRDHGMHAKFFFPHKVPYEIHDKILFFNKDLIRELSMRELEDTSSQCSLVQKVFIEHLGTRDKRKNRT